MGNLARRDRPRRGKYRLRTWLRKHEPSWLYDRWPVPKGSGDCGNHEFYAADDEVDRCYHCLVGVRHNDRGAIERAQLMIEAGVPREEVIQAFRKAGLTWIRSVRAFALASGMSLGDAKGAIAKSETWADERPAREALEEALVAVLGEFRDGRTDGV